MSTEINKGYEDLFKQFKKEQPDWHKYLTDSTYYELMAFYDEKNNIPHKIVNSMMAHSFANYIWYKHIEKPSKHKFPYDVLTWQDVQGIIRIADYLCNSLEYDKIIELGEEGYYTKVLDEFKERRR